MLVLINRQEPSCCDLQMKFGNLIVSVWELVTNQRLRPHLAWVYQWAIIRCKILREGAGHWMKDWAVFSDDPRITHGSYSLMTQGSFMVHIVCIVWWPKGHTHGSCFLITQRTLMGHSLAFGDLWLDHVISVIYNWNEPWHATISISDLLMTLPFYPKPWTTKIYSSLPA